MNSLSEGCCFREISFPLPSDWLNVPLDHQIIETACQQLAEWNKTLGDAAKDTKPPIRDRNTGPELRSNFDLIRTKRLISQAPNSPGSVGFIRQLLLGWRESLVSVYEPFDFLDRHRVGGDSNCPSDIQANDFAIGVQQRPTALLRLDYRVMRDNDGKARTPVAERSTAPLIGAFIASTRALPENRFDTD